MQPDRAAMTGMDARVDAVLLAATELAARRRCVIRGPRLPSTVRPVDLEVAWEIQQKASELAGQAIAGWKAAMPSDDRFVAAPIHADAFHHCTGERAPVGHRAIGARQGATVEPELAYRLGTDLPPRTAPYTRKEVESAVQGIHLALEICASSFDLACDPSYPELLADGLFNNGLVLGPAIGGPAPWTLALAIRTTESDGKSTEWNLAGIHPAGDPVLPLVWLANFLRARGIGLRAGQFVITGSYCPALALAEHCRLEVGFGTHGHVAVQFFYAISKEGTP